MTAAAVTVLPAPVVAESDAEDSPLPSEWNAFRAVSS